MPEKPEDPLKRRGDNVGQSGRWRRDDGKSEGAKRYGHEEGKHNIEHPRPDTKPTGGERQRPTK